MARNLELLESFKVIQWRDANKSQWPELGLLIHVPNEGKRSVQAAVKLVKAGLVSGVADFLLLTRLLAIEMKSPTGRQSEKQVAFADLFTRFGGEYHVCRSAIECVAIIKRKLGI